MAHQKLISAQDMRIKRLSQGQVQGFVVTQLTTLL
jgi:hypothetical protein